MIWIQALGSVAFDLVNPKPEMVDFDTIAKVLSRLPRWCGQTERDVLSVAQHCHEGAQAILRDTGRSDWAAAFALHDAHEAYIGDIPTPVVRALCNIGGQGYEPWGDIVKGSVDELKRRIDVAIYTAAGIPFPLDLECAKIVKLYDRRMGRTERNERMGEKPEGVEYNGTYDTDEPLQGVDLYPWSQGTTEKVYRNLLRDLIRR